MKQIYKYGTNVIIATTLMLLSMVMLLLPTATAASYSYEFTPEGPVQMALFCSVMIGALILWLYVTTWLYKDAEARGKSGAVWVVLWIITSVLGLIIWFIVRPKGKIR